GHFSGDSKAWPYDGSYLDFKAIHGNFGSTVTKNSTDRDTEITHSVLSTQSSETEVRESDLLYASKDNAPTGKTVELSFGHMLSKIVVKLVPSDLDNTGSGISGTDLDNATVTIIGVQPQATFKLSAMVAATTGTPTNISLGSGGAGIREYECIVPPQNIAEGSEFIRIELKDEGRTDKRKFHYVIPSGGLTLEKGNKYIYTLTVKNYITSIPGEVVPWDESDSENPLEWKVMLFMPVVMPWNSKNFSFEWRWITPNPDGVVDWTNDNEETNIQEQNP
ncbi:MAG: fimbrillin family protein, partial [Prevotella sp.]